MASCPNCGRQTLRTKDWACQWCGYPLISRAFKKIDKTFKELQEERSLGSMTVDSDMDIEPQHAHGHGTEEEPEIEQEVEPESEPEVEPPPKPAQKPRFRLFGKRQPFPPPRSDSAPRPERHQRPPESPVSRPEPEPPSKPVQRPKPPVERVHKPEPAPEPVSETLTEPVQPEVSPDLDNPLESVQSPAPPPPAAKPEPEPEPEAAYPPPPPPERPAAKPEILVERRLPPVSSVKPEDIKDGMEISVDDLDALFRMDKAGTNLKLNGKTIMLKGIVEKVFIKEHLEIRYIMVKGANKTVWSARCTFEKENTGKANKLTEGSAVAVRGKYDGYGKNVIFKDCEIV